LFGNGRFAFYAAVFCTVLLRIVFLNVSSSFFKRFIPKTVLFSNKTYQICHCEEGAILRQTRQS